MPKAPPPDRPVPVEQYLDLTRRAGVLPVFGLEVEVASLDDVIISKSPPGEPKMPSRCQSCASFAMRNSIRATKMDPEASHGPRRVESESVVVQQAQVAQADRAESVTTTADSRPFSYETSGGGDYTGIRHLGIGICLALGVKLPCVLEVGSPKS